MPERFAHKTWKRRSKAGKELDKLFHEHKIGYAYYNKICDKPIYWEKVSVSIRKYLC